MIVNKSKGWVSKPWEYEYIDSTVIDGKEIHCKFDIDYGYKETRYEPGDDGGLWLTEAIVDGKNIVEELSEKDIETLTNIAENTFWSDYSEYESGRVDYLRELSEDR